MATSLSVPLGPRLLAGLGLAALLGGLGLVSSRPARSGGGPVPVTVANPSVPVHPTDQAAPTEPFQHTFQPTSDTDNRISETITVPAHKRLVIEYVSASLNEYPPGVGGYVYLATTSGGETVYYYVTDSVQDFNKRNQTVRIYADPGTTVTVGAVSGDNTTPGIGTDTEVSGYYVDVP